MLLFVLFTVPSAPAWSEAVHSAADVNVKYYVVQSTFQGNPETLSRIAQRFLGDSARADDIFALNVGRAQSDGGRLTDPDTLRPGWVLVLPWDAVGTGVQYGPLPKPQPPSPPVSPPAPPAPPPPAPPATAKCAGTSPVPNNASQWAQLRLAPEQAWPRTRGDGVVVALVDSGVDGSLPQLAGRVAAGADVVSGTRRGNTDCIGSGTAMAGLIAGQSAETNGGVIGVAPAATVVPIKVVAETPVARPADQVSGIDIAISTGATVLVLGSYVDIRDPAVAVAVARATDHGMVVVMQAPTDENVAAPLKVLIGGSTGGAILRVGGIGIDGGLVEKYAPGSVDVVAPGADVATLGISGTGDFWGTGTRYAVALAAGQVALVRASDPTADASAIVQKIKDTASRVGQGMPPDPDYGWGLINPEKATAPEPPPPSPTATPQPSPSSAPTGAIVAAVVIAIVCAALLVVRVRRAIRRGGDDGAEAAPPGDGPWQDVPPPPDDEVPPGLPQRVSGGHASASSRALDRERGPTPTQNGSGAPRWSQRQGRSSEAADAQSVGYDSTYERTPW